MEREKLCVSDVKFSDKIFYIVQYMEKKGFDLKEFWATGIWMCRKNRNSKDKSKIAAKIIDKNQLFWGN